MGGVCGCAEVTRFLAIKALNRANPLYVAYIVKNLPETLKGDREIILQALNRANPLNVADIVKDLPETLKGDREIILQAVKQKGLALQYAAQALKSDRQIVLQALKTVKRFDDFKVVMEKCSETLKGDRVFMSEALNLAFHYDVPVVKHLPETWKGDREIILQALNHANPVYLPGMVKDLPETLKGDREIILQALNHASPVDVPGMVKDLPETLKGDREIILQAVGTRGEVLKFAAEALKSDREFVLQALNHASPVYVPGMVKDLPETLKGDREIIFEALNRTVPPYVPDMVNDLPETLKGDREIILQAVEKSGRALVHAAEALKGDRDFMLEALKRAEPRYVADIVKDLPETLKGDRGIILQAVKWNGYALAYTAQALKSDRQIVLQAVKNDGYYLRFACRSLQKDKEVCLEATRRSGYHGWLYVDENLKLDPDILRAKEAASSGLTVGSERITYEGNVVEDSPTTTVSFPGKYPKSWNAATGRRDLSVACVFLTTKDKGLGCHTSRCRCSELYGTVDSERYLAIIEKPKEDDKLDDYEKALADAKKDAEAMGQLLIEELQHEPEAWDRVKREAREKAARLAKDNNFKAPWGCQWFQTWLDNVEKAVALGQELLVVFFPDKKGKGKVRWSDLCKPEKISEALKDNGLGASQRAEVAYLDKMGYRYQELDLNEFASRYGLPREQ